MELKNVYKDRNLTPKTYHDLEKYCTYKIHIDKDRGNSQSYIVEKDKVTRVWLLFAGGKDGSDKCLQVGHSKYDSANEAKDIIQFLFTNADNNVSEYGNSAFYVGVCPKAKDYRKSLYTMIGNNYTRFIICFLDVDQYLGIKKNVEKPKTEIEKIIEICKNQYAEARIAYDTLAVYWRPYNSGIDGQTISYLAEEAMYN